MRKPTGREMTIGGAALAAAAGIALGARALIKRRKAAQEVVAKAKPHVKAKVARAKKTVRKVARRVKSAGR